MSKWYGNIDNRIEENRQYVKEIKVGDGVTEYLWSDRHPYEVSKVINQKHIFIREMDWERTDSNGMSECQEYRYISNPKNNEYELRFKYNHWYKITHWTDREGKTHRKSIKINISIGVMERYYDFSF